MREKAMAIFNAAVSAVQPSSLLPQNICLKDDLLLLHQQTFSLKQWSRIYVIGAGKASAAMALETEKILGKHIDKGIVVTKYGHALPLQKIKCMEAGHPLPDENSIHAGNQILELVQQANEKDLIIFLVSGGASSLMADLPPGITLEQLQQLFSSLLHCGASINEMNTVRKHLSLIKGGQLAKAAYPATVVSFILSDVIDDELEVIASGPTVPDTTTFQDAYQVLERYDLIKKIHPSIIQWMQKGVNKVISDTPKPGDQIFEKVSNHLIGTNRIALEAAANKAIELGYHTIVLTDRLSGEALEQAVIFCGQHLQTH